MALGALPRMELPMTQRLWTCPEHRPRRRARQRQPRSWIAWIVLRAVFVRPATRADFDGRPDWMKQPTEADVRDADIGFARPTSAAPALGSG